jgi:glycosyltransferase involved in cell wall biosynthesis
MASGDRYSSRFLNFVGPELPAVGYGRMFVSLKESLAQRVQLDAKAEHTVWAMQPDMVKGWLHGTRKTILTMWETDKLPPKFFEYLPQFDTVIVPCLHNFDLFSQHHDNVHVIPLGVDRTVWHPAARPDNDKFRIVAGGSEWMRKGLDVVLEVFQMLGMPNSELHLKIVPPYRGAPEVRNWPNVVVHDDWMSLEDEVNLVRSADVFISASRGEGFGLMPLQAISAGVPTIVTDAHGHREFSDLASHRISTSPSRAKIGKWDSIGNWDEPNREELAAAILDVRANLEKYRAQALVNAEETAAFNWDTAADQLLQIVKPSDKKLDTNWVLAGEVTTPIRVTRKVVADIGAHHVDLRPGQVYHVVLNVRDVLAEAGYLEI